MMLSILIPTLPERKPYLEGLLKSIGSTPESVEIIIHETDNNITTGAKRNYLHSVAKGDYVWFVDDDDELMPNAVNRVLEGCETGADVIGINGFMTTDGANRVDWEIRIGHKYEAVKRNGKEYYLRFPNHITPMKKSIATQVRFPDKYIMEDYEWALKVKNMNLLKTQYAIDEPIYHYKFRTRK